MNRFVLILSGIACLSINTGCSQSHQDKKLPGGCEDCELMLEGMPATVSWKTSIAPPDEPGEHLIIRGTIFRHDGKTPAPDVILYVYHTDNRGLYSPGQNQYHGKRHGHLRGWVKTNALGQYEFKTIRPASYPNSRNPQHIHPIIKEPGIEMYWIDDFLFSDDPLLQKEKPNRLSRGGSGIISVSRNNAGVWVGKRDIVLGKNIEGY